MQKSTSAYPKLTHIGSHRFSVTNDGHIGANQNPRFNIVCISKKRWVQIGPLEFGQGARMQGQRISAPLNYLSMPQAHSSLTFQALNNSSWGPRDSEEPKNNSEKYKSGRHKYMINRDTGFYGAGCGRIFSLRGVNIKAWR